MVKIHTAYGEKPPRRASHPGNRMEPHYIEKYDETGHPYLEKDGETDVYEEIQSHKEEGDITALLARYAAGDMSVIRNGATYIDATQLPTTIHEMYNLQNKAKEQFNALPAEIKQKFENSLTVWASTAGSPEWVEKMGLKPKNAEIAKPAEGIEVKA